MTHWWKKNGDKGRDGTCSKTTSCPTIHKSHPHKDLYMWCIHYCKVVLATSRTELTQIQDGVYTAVDPTSPRSSMPYRSFMAWCIPGAVHRGYAHAGRSVGSPESAVTSSETQNGVYKGTGRCFARFLWCVEVYHSLDHLDMLYWGIHAYCSL